MASVPIYPARTSAVPLALRILTPLGSRWTYLRLLYLALAFPLGLLYFVSLLPGFVAGGALSWTIPGWALLILMVLITRWYGDMDAELARRLVGVEIRRPPTWYERDVPIREQAKQVLLDPSTWTGIVYLFSRFPLGIVALVATVVSMSVSLAFTFAPLIYEVWRPMEGGLHADGWMQIGGWAIDTRAEAWAAVPLGIAGFLVALHGLNLLAWLYARWARLMLGSRARDIPAPPARLQDGPPVVAMPAQGLIVGLTPREREVLLLIARGYSNAEIAEAFVVSEGTVKTHVKRILAKLNVRDRTQAAILAFDSGFVTPEMASEPEPR
ncbi:MAG: sensor domain-containing protein [Dehalococcoidia bacterium]|nr:sensor domain-containing protein [Dehalococcoidia bacterium]